MQDTSTRSNTSGIDKLVQYWKSHPLLLIIILLLSAVIGIIAMLSADQRTQLPAIGGLFPTITPTLTASPSPTITLTPTPTQTQTPIPTPTSDKYPEILTLASNFDGTNTDWEPQSWIFADDRVATEVVIVPVGSFEMGSPTDEPQRDTDEIPHIQTVSEPFWIDRYEVTNEQFAEFLNENENRSPDPHPYWVKYFDDGKDLSRIYQKGDTWEVEVNYEQHPVAEVTWFGARDFCLWRGMRLPTELEWEYAASGPSNWIYPWGNDWSADHIVYGHTSGEDTNPVGTKPSGVSWVGAYNMAGNVVEWTSSRFDIYPYDASHEVSEGVRNSSIMRGGSWQWSNTEFHRTASRSSTSAVNAYPYVGFRCARDS